jgi:hypothetical protein
MPAPERFVFSPHGGPSSRSDLSYRANLDIRSDPTARAR